MSGDGDIKSLHGCSAVGRPVESLRCFQRPVHHLPVTVASKRDKGRQGARIRSAEEAAAVEVGAESGTGRVWVRAAHSVALQVGVGEEEGAGGGARGPGDAEG